MALVCLMSRLFMLTSVDLGGFSDNHAMNERFCHMRLLIIWV